MLPKWSVTFPIKLAFQQHALSFPFGGGRQLQNKEVHAGVAWTRLKEQLNLSNKALEKPPLDGRHRLRVAVGKSMINCEVKCISLQQQGRKKGKSHRSPLFSHCNSMGDSSDFRPHNLCQHNHHLHTCTSCFLLKPIWQSTQEIFDAATHCHRSKYAYNFNSGGNTVYKRQPSH